MCGIAGIIATGDPAKVEHRPRAMQNALLHRGPYDSGVATMACGDWTISLAHTRLAILDLTAEGHQPMLGRNHDSWITYNGEVYSFRELREELPDQDFRSNSDTEVLLRAYDTWGMDALAK